MVQLAVSEDSHTLTQSLQRLDLAAKFFRGFADPVRLAILHTLEDGEHSVEEICGLLDCKQPRISNHLAYLRWCGFVQNRRDGNRVYYSIKDRSVLDILHKAEEAIAAHAEWVSAAVRL
jgi:ArsR family transcriptional regulator